MRLCVIGNQMAAFRNLLGQRLAFTHKTTNHKKCGFGVVLIEQVQQPWRDRRIWSIVKRKRQIAADLQYSRWWRRKFASADDTAAYETAAADSAATAGTPISAGFIVLIYSGLRRDCKSIPSC